MQVPEKLSLIGGSILLASTLVFTLKSQASNILPKVDSGVSSLVNADKSGQSSNDSSQSQQPSQQDQQKQQQAQADQTFNNNFQQAQQKGWQTGQWGSSKYYIDSGNNLHVGSGQLNGAIGNAIGNSEFVAINSINLDGPVQAPQYSEHLFANGNNTQLHAINGLNQLDTSHTTDMIDMFDYNVNLTNLDLSHFDTSHVTNMEEMFMDDSSLSNINLSNFDTSNVTNMDNMFEGDNIHQLNLGSNTKLQDNPSNSYYNSNLSGNYQSNGQTSNLVDGNAHPGTWIKQ